MQYLAECCATVIMKPLTVTIGTGQKLRNCRQSRANATEEDRGLEKQIAKLKKLSFTVGE